MYIHQNTVDFLDLGYGSALAVVMFVCQHAVDRRLPARDARARELTRWPSRALLRPPLCAGSPRRWSWSTASSRRLWILFTSLKTEAELTAEPITWLPARADARQLCPRLLRPAAWTLFLFNSVVVALLSTAATLFVSVLAAYALARLQVRFRDLILSAIIAVSTFPLVTLLVPLFETMRALNLLNTYTALVLPYIVLSLPVCTLVLVSFFEGIPRDLENAAMVDGCTRIGALCSRSWCRWPRPACSPPASSPSSTPGTSSCSPCPSTPRPTMRTLPVGITLYQGEFAFPGR